MARRILKNKPNSPAPKLASTKPTKKNGMKKGKNMVDAISTPSRNANASAKKIEKQDCIPVTGTQRATRSKSIKSSQSSVKSDSSLIDKTLKIELKRIADIDDAMKPKRFMERSRSLSAKRRRCDNYNSGLDNKTTPPKIVKKASVKKTTKKSRNVKNKIIKSCNGEEEKNDEEQKNNLKSLNSSRNKHNAKISIKKKKFTKKSPKKSNKKNKNVNDKLTSEFIKPTEVPNPDTNGDNKSPNENIFNIGSFITNPLFNRKFIPNPSDAKNVDINSDGNESNANNSCSNSTKSFTIASYNILADCHAQRDYTNSAWISKEELSIEYRHKRLMEEVKFINADVFCFQEVGTSYYSDMLKPSMALIGYDGIYVPRQWGEESNDEGEATFYKTSTFKLGSYKNLLLENFSKKEIEKLASIKSEPMKESMKKSVQSYAVSLLTQLKSVSGNGSLYVANVHICYDKFERQDKQCLQIATTIRELQKLCSKKSRDADDDVTKVDNGDDDESIEDDNMGPIHPQIICGDFNSWPTSVPQRFMREGHLSEEDVKSMLNIPSVSLDDGGQVMTSLFSQWEDAFHFDPSPNYKSAYEVVAGSDPYTSRFNMDGSVRQVDFIYYSSNTLIPTKVLEVPDRTQIENGAPNSVYPSDHLSIMAEFNILN